MLLSGVLKEVTRANLEKLPITSKDLDDGAKRIRDAGLPLEEEDVSLIVAALWPSFRQDFIEIAGTWRGRPSALARFLQALASQKEGYD